MYVCIAYKQVSYVIANNAVTKTSGQLIFCCKMLFYLLNSFLFSFFCFLMFNCFTCMWGINHAFVLHTKYTWYARITTDIKLFMNTHTHSHPHRPKSTNKCFFGINICYSKLIFPANIHLLRFWWNNGIFGSLVFTKLHKDSYAAADRIIANRKWNKTRCHKTKYMYIYRLLFLSFLVPQFFCSVIFYFFFFFSFSR